MNTKSKGSNAERELVHKFWDNGWAAIRVAGSGSNKYPSPDILASNNMRKLAIEAKVVAERKKYFPEDEIKQLLFFSERFGAESWIAVKFINKKWFFFAIEDMERTKNDNYVVSVEMAELKGLKFEEMIKT